MTFHHIDAHNALYYEHTRPARDGAVTFVFVNALTGNTQAWEAIVGPSLREDGFGTLSYNFRGQDNSAFGEDVALTPDLIARDLKDLLDAVQPVRPIVVGLSIGGLFAAHAYLDGMNCEGLVLLNTLREIGPRISWVNDVMPVIVKAGGVSLFLDALFPLLVNPDFAKSVRAQFIKGNYEPLPPSHGHANFMKHAALADWDIPYEKLALPIHVITGLHDRVFLDRDVVERLFDLLPEATCEEWHDAGHLLPQERPEKLARSLAKFGQEIEAKRP
ncbi:MAG: alpha/beta hydrolase [Hyphomicrobiales bacterium]